MAVDWGVYVHVPLCVKKCEYCDFCSVSSSPSLEKEVPLRLGVELKGALEEHLSDEDRISSVFIGGGTPSVIPAKDIAPLLKRIREWLGFGSNDIEWTIECNPGTVDREKLELYRQFGINRLSIGCQSIHDDELRALGRIHTADDFFRTYDLARECGFEKINVDLMNAIPGQTLGTYEQTLNKIVGLNPEHISAYSLIIEPGTPFYERYADDLPVDEDTDRLMYEITCDILKSAGYVHYEVSNYAKRKTNFDLDSVGETENMHSSNPADNKIENNAYACRHNLNYWRRGSYIGVGPSAASFYEGLGCYGTRTKRISDFRGWLTQTETGSDTEKEIETLSREEAMTETVFLGLRMREGVNLTRLNDQFGFDAKSIWRDEIERLSAEGYMDMKNDSIYIYDNNWFISDSITGRLLRYI